MMIWRVFRLTETEDDGLTITTREQRFSAEHLCQDTSNAPHVDRAGIFLEGEHDFGSTIPSGRVRKWGDEK